MQPLQCLITILYASACQRNKCRAENKQRHRVPYLRAVQSRNGRLPLPSSRSGKHSSSANIKCYRGYAACDMDMVSKDLVDVLWYDACRKRERSIMGMKNFSRAWLEKPMNHKMSNIGDHTNSEQ